MTKFGDYPILGEITALIVYAQSKCALTGIHRRNTFMLYVQMTLFMYWTEIFIQDYRFVRLQLGPITYLITCLPRMLWYQASHVVWHRIVYWLPGNQGLFAQGLSVTSCTKVLGRWKFVYGLSTTGGPMTRHSCGVTEIMQQVFIGLRCKGSYGRYRVPYTPYSARMSPENTHKPYGILYGGLILDILL